MLLTWSYDDNEDYTRRTPANAAQGWGTSRSLETPGVGDGHRNTDSSLWDSKLSPRPADGLPKQSTKLSGRTASPRHWLRPPPRTRSRNQLNWITKKRQTTPRVDRRHLKVTDVLKLTQPHLDNHQSSIGRPGNDTTLLQIRAWISTVVHRLKSLTRSKTNQQSVFKIPHDTSKHRNTVCRYWL